jgi:hypothetical protein
MSRQVRIVGLSAALAALAVAPASAVAARSSKPQLAPAAPHRTTPITVTWKAKKPKRGTRYTASLSIRNPSGRTCVDVRHSVVLHATRNGFEGTLKGPPAAPPWSRPRQWCTGSALVTIRRAGPGNLVSNVLAGARVTITVGPGETAPREQPLGVPTKVILLPGSTLTATAAGRPDRSTPLTGTVRGLIPGRFKPNTDIEITNSTGVVTPTAFAADPLCPGENPLASIDTVAPSKMVLFASGAATFDLTLNASASQVFGCGPSGAPAGTTTLPLSGNVGPKGLLELTLNGAITDVPLPGGSTGGLAANLIVNVDLSGQS